MASVMDFFLRLVGSSPEQLAAEEEFRRSIKQHEEGDAALDAILKDLKKINSAAERQIDLNRTLLPFSINKDDTPTAGTG